MISIRWDPPTTPEAQALLAQSESLSAVSVPFAHPRSKRSLLKNSFLQSNTGSRGKHP
jgi:hypothetical protein